MSIIEEIKEANTRREEERKNVAVEHMAELERLRIASEGYKNPALIAFRERRKKQAMRNKF